MMGRSWVIGVLLLTACTSAEAPVDAGRAPLPAEDASTPLDAQPKDADPADANGRIRPEVLDGGAGTVGVPATPPDGGFDAGASPFVTGDPPHGDPRLLAGTGTRGFEPVLQGDELPWTMGIQGGYHIYGGLLAAHALLDPLSSDARDSVIHSYEIRRAQDEVLIAETARRGFLQRREDGWQSAGQLVILDDSIAPEATAGELLIYTVTLALPDAAYTSRVYIYARCCE